MSKKIQILSSEEINQKTRRMAYQIVEENYDETELIFIGIKQRTFKAVCVAERFKLLIEIILSVFDKEKQLFKVNREAVGRR